MKRYWIVVSLLLLFLLAIFLLIEQLNPSFLTFEAGTMNTPTLGAALGGVALLIADIILPVPSSMVMIANGALFGVITGTILSLIGSAGAALAGFFLGQRSENWLARYVPPEERLRANQLLDEWGWLAIMITRPIPLLAETTVIMAGSSKMKLGTVLVSAIAGSLPVSLLYALTGATAANFDNTLLAFGLALLIAAILWLIGRYLRNPLSSRVAVKASNELNTD